MSEATNWSVTSISHQPRKLSRLPRRNEVKAGREPGKVLFPPVFLRLDAELDRGPMRLGGNRSIAPPPPAFALGFFREKVSRESDARKDEQETAKCDDYQFSQTHEII